MQNVRTYRSAPFQVAVLHGGPGAAGDVAPVAREISKTHGVLEPLQTRDSIRGQIEELRDVVDRHGDPPMRIIGHSWGAWLGYLFAARYPSLVDKLILVGSGPFEEKYVQDIADRRLSRLSEGERAELETIQEALGDPDVQNKDALLKRFGSLFGGTDTYDSIPGDESDSPGVQFDIFERVWGEAAALRRSGELLAIGSDIRCDVVAIHGDYDPHPARGVRDPLERTIRQFRFISIERCGHKPWIERWGRDTFYEILAKELSATVQAGQRGA